MDYYIRQEVKKILQYARNLIEKGWCKGWFAKTRGGRCTRTNAADACKFCAVGAIDRARDDVAPNMIKWDVERVARQQLSRVMGTTDISKYNDSHTKRTVLKKFDEAIASL